MKNVRDYDKKTCIFLGYEDFYELFDTLFEGKIEASYEMDGISYDRDGDEPADIEMIYDRIACYYDVGKVTSIHADDSEFLGVWICYEGEFYIPQESGIYACDIRWSLDEEDKAYRDLPSFVRLPESVTDIEDVADYLSDTYGFCVCSYMLHRVA